MISITYIESKQKSHLNVLNQFYTEGVSKFDVYHFVSYKTTIAPLEQCGLSIEKWRWSLM